MSQKILPPEHRKPNRYVMAMVIGTALSALGPTAALAEPRTDAQGRAINDISRYCTACWRNARLDPDCWNDCTQEVFCRLLERVTPDAWGRLLKVEGEERREFLRAIDAVKKRMQRGRRWSNPLVDDVLADRREMAERQLADERANLEHASAQLLNPRQRRILQLSAEGWSVHEIGSELQIPPARVSDEKYKAICKLREHFSAEPAGA